MSEASDGVSLTRRLLQIDTINPPGRERPCAETLAAILEPAGLSVSYHELGEGRASLVAMPSKPHSQPPICFTGHIDTVPLGAAAWSRDPFAGETANGLLYGRGSTDMKSGVAAMVAAVLRHTARKKAAPNVMLVFTAGEETGCDGAYALVRDQALPKAAQAIVVGEPTTNRPLVAHKGALWLRVKLRGVTAHGSMPEKGVNAVAKAARLITSLEEFSFGAKADPCLGGPTLNVGTISGGMNLNSVPDAAEVGLDIRTVPAQSHEDIKRRIAGLLEAGDEVEELVDVEALSTPGNDPWIQSVFKSVQAVTDEKTEEEGATYFTDGPVLKQSFGGPPTVVLGPGEPSMAHQTDEYCRVERIEQSVEIYERILDSA